MNEHTIKYCHPSDLKVHPLNKALPALADDDARYLAMVASIQECGIKVPLICDAEHQVIDGAHRLRAAKRLGLPEVPVVVESDDEVASTIIATLVDRKHYTKGQMAYICAPVIETAFKEAKARRASSATPAALPKTSDLLADRLGISERLIRQARELIRIFAQDDEFKAEMEPLVLAAEDPVGLGAAIAGYAGRSATKGKEKSGKRDAEQLWLKGFNGLLFQTSRLGDVKTLQPKIKEALESCEDMTELRRLNALGKTIAEAARLRLKKLSQPR